MRIRSICVGIAGCLLGAATAQAEPPAWCKDAQAREKPNATDWAHLDTDQPSRAISVIANALCFPNDHTKHDAGIIAKGVELWSARLGMNEADWADAAAYQANRYHNNFAPKDYTKPWSTLSPIEQYLTLTGHFSDSAQKVDMEYLDDAL